MERLERLEVHYVTVIHEYYILGMAPDYETYVAHLPHFTVFSRN